MVRGGRREEGSGWGTRVYLWWIHVDIWQNQYDVVKLKNKRNKNKKIKNLSVKPSCPGLFLGIVSLMDSISLLQMSLSIF